MEPGGITYDLKDERVTIVYADGFCAKGWPYGWNVSPGTVVGITSIPKTHHVLSELQVDLTKYKKKQVDYREISYYNDEDGINIVTSNSDDVWSIEYLPVSADARLMCPESLARETAVKKGTAAQLNPIVSYFDVSKHDEHIRLNYFSDHLKQSASKSLVYIIGYACNPTCPHEAEQRFGSAKRYLVNVRKIPNERIRTINGGYNDSLWVELYIVVPSGPTPLSSPNIPPDRVKLRDGCNPPQKLDH